MHTMDVEQPGGPTIHLRTWGSGTDACLLVHGFGDGGFVWEGVGPTFARRYRTFALDLRGHGDSGWDPQGRYELEHHVSDTVQIIRNLGLKRLVLVGHSMGANIAIRAAFECTELIIGVIIVDFGPALNPVGVGRVLCDFREAHRLYDNVEEYASWLSRRRPLADPALLLRVAESALKRTTEARFVVKADLAMASTNHTQSTSSDDERLWGLLRRMNWPVLLVRGSGSAVLPHSVAERMARVLPRAHYRTIKLAGHAVMLDNPREFRDITSAFLMSLSKYPNKPAP